MHYLIVSPTPFEPTTAGNRLRIKAVIQRLKAQGHRVTFLYSIQEGQLDEASARTMATQVDAFQAIDYDLNQRVLHRIKARHDAEQRGEVFDKDTANWGLDDWYPVNLEHAVAAIHAADPIDAVICVYLWISAFLETLPAGVVKMVDTIDVMTDRARRLAAAGIPNDYFSLSEADERRGLARADLVLAIQEEEELRFRRITDTPVMTLGHPAAPLPRPARPGSSGRRLVAGYIGALNNSNVRAVQYILAAATDPTFGAHIDFVIAGGVSRLLKGKDLPGNVRSLGEVGDPVDFYRVVDVALNPADSGTGLKLKTLEALQRDVATLSTRIGSEGLRSPFSFHNAARPERLFAILAGLGRKPELVDAVRQAGRLVLAAYNQRAEEGYQRLADPRAAIQAAEPVVMPETLEPALVEPALDATKRLGLHPVIIDVGSGGGAWARLFAERLTGARLTLVEWRPEETIRLKANRALLRHPRVAGVILGYRPGPAEGYVALGSDGLERPVETLPEAGRMLPMGRLADLIPLDPRPTLIRIDLLDLAPVLAGLGPLFRRVRPALLLRVAEVEPIRAWGLSQGYGIVREFPDPAGGSWLLLRNRTY